MNAQHLPRIALGAFCNFMVISGAFRFIIVKIKDACGRVGESQGQPAENRREGRGMWPRGFESTSDYGYKANEFR